MRKVIPLLVLLALMASVAMAGEVNLSKMISDTYPLAGKCPPINDEVAYTLASQTDASVYFAHCGGFVSGFMVAGDTVYATPNGPPCDGGQWYQMTRAVRCGNPAEGRFFVPMPETPAPEVIVVTEVQTVTEYIPQIVEKEVVRTERCVNVNLNLPAFPQRQFIAPAGVSTVWTPALSVPIGSQTTTHEVKAWGTLAWRPDERQQKVCPPKPPPPGPPPPGPPPPPPPPPPPDDGTCGPLPPGETIPTPTPPEAAVPGTPGDGAQGSELGDNNGYPTLPPPPGGYGGEWGSGEASPPGVGPGLPGPRVPPPDVSNTPGGGLVTPASAR